MEEREEETEGEGEFWRASGGVEGMEMGDGEIGEE